MSRCVTTEVWVNSQIRVIGNVSFSRLLVTFSIKANFAFVTFFSQVKKNILALLLFHKISLKLLKLATCTPNPVIQFISNYAYYQYFL